jgi:hypothetical protein
VLGLILHFHLGEERINPLLHLLPADLLLLRLRLHRLQHELGPERWFGFVFRSCGDHTSSSTNQEWNYRGLCLREQFRLAQTQPTTIQGFYGGTKGERICSHDVPEDLVSLIPHVMTPVAYQWLPRWREVRLQRRHELSPTCRGRIQSSHQPRVELQELVLT